MSSSEGSEGRLLRGVGAGMQQAPEPENLACPRCSSSNTKFCYYNNYNLSQPRYFCKSCRRYWTRGGSLRNVPVGGGSRKNSKRSRPDPPPLPSPAPSNTAPFQTEAGLPGSFTALLGSQQECGFMGLGGYSLGLGPVPGPDPSQSFAGFGAGPSGGSSSSGCNTWQTEGMDDGDYIFGWPGPTAFQ